jgi:hypothetical protein
VTEIIKRIRRIGENVMNEIRGEEPCTFCNGAGKVTAQPGSIEMPCPFCAQKKRQLSRRGFISMLGAGAIVAALPAGDGVPLNSIAHPYQLGGLNVTKIFTYEHRITELVIDPRTVYTDQLGENIGHRYTEALLKSLAQTRWEVEQRVIAQMVAEGKW